MGRIQCKCIKVQRLFRVNQRVEAVIPRGSPVRDLRQQPGDTQFEQPTQKMNTVDAEPNKRAAAEPYAFTRSRLPLLAAA
jgi:hypothetical protein